MYGGRGTPGSVRCRPGWGGAPAAPGAAPRRLRLPRDYISQRPPRPPPALGPPPRGLPGVVVRRRRFAAWRRCWAAAALAWLACGAAAGGCGGAGGGRRAWPAAAWASAWSGWTWRCGAGSGGQGRQGEAGGRPAAALTVPLPLPVWQMTGLDVEKDQILEMACLITDSDLNVLAEVRGSRGPGPATGPPRGAPGPRGGGLLPPRRSPPGSGPGCSGAAAALAMSAPPATRGQGGPWGRYLARPSGRLAPSTQPLLQPPESAGLQPMASVRCRAGAVAAAAWYPTCFGYLRVFPLPARALT